MKNQNELLPVSFSEKNLSWAGILLLLLGLGLQACGGIIVGVRPEPDVYNTNVFPHSVRIELREFDHQTIAGYTWEDDEFKHAIIRYLEKRGTFRKVVDGPSDLVLTVDAKCTYAVFVGLNCSIKGSLTAGEQMQSDGKPLGLYAGEGKQPDLIIGDPVEYRAKTMGQALDKLFLKIERNSEAILAKVGMGPTPAIAATIPGSITPATPVISSSDVEHLPVATVKPRKNAYAIVIGIEQYREKLPRADFADKDAKLVGEYLTKMMGYPEENVIVRLNERATRTDLVKYFEEWLKNNVELGGSVFVYYSGHGAPNTKTGEAYLVPYDGDPSFVDSTAYPVKQLYAALDKLPAKDVTVVLDSCFSGAGGRSVLAKGARPMGLSIENQVLATGKTVVLAASGGDQISNSFEEKGHGLLTYFFLKGLQGDGDTNKDGMIEMAELYDYVKPNVQRIARKQYNNEQTPQLLASPDVLKKGGGRLVERAN